MTEEMKLIKKLFKSLGFNVVNQEGVDHGKSFVGGTSGMTVKAAIKLIKISQRAE